MGKWMGGMITPLFENFLCLPFDSESAESASHDMQVYEGRSLGEASDWGGETNPERYGSSGSAQIIESSRDFV